MRDFGEIIFTPSTPVLIVVTALIALVPIVLHFVVFRSSFQKSLPRILVLGPSGSGKTSLCIWFEKGRALPTQTSQTPLALQCSIPASITSSASYKSENEPGLKEKFLICDTPGHAKLRHLAMEQLQDPLQKPKGVIFVLDSADDISKAAEYLHDVLLTLQKTLAKSSGRRRLNLLIACNKNDLFTAMPAGRIKAQLEKEITRIRESRAKGLMDSGAGGVDALDQDDDEEWLGEGGEGEFKLEMMDDAGLDITIKSGSVEKPGCEKWRKWVGSCL